MCILAKLFRSLRVDAIVEPLRIFSDAAPASANQRPDILLHNRLPHPTTLKNTLPLAVLVIAIDMGFDQHFITDLTFKLFDSPSKDISLCQICSLTRILNSP